MAIVFRLNDTDDLLSHNRDIYNKLEKLANYTQKLCRCNVNGTVCSYKHYQECKTDLWGPELACKLLESKRKRRDVRMLQDMYSLYQKQNQSKVYFKTKEHSYSPKVFIFIDKYNSVNLFTGTIDFLFYFRDIEGRRQNHKLKRFQYANQPLKMLNTTRYVSTISQILATKH